MIYLNLGFLFNELINPLSGPFRDISNALDLFFFYIWRVILELLHIWNSTSVPIFLRSLFFMCLIVCHFLHKPTNWTLVQFGPDREQCAAVWSGMSESPDQRAQVWKMYDV